MFSDKKTEESLLVGNGNDEEKQVQNGNQVVGQEYKPEF